MDSYSAMTNRTQSVQRDAPKVIDYSMGSYLFRTYGTTNQLVINLKLVVGNSIDYLSYSRAFLI